MFRQDRPIRKSFSLFAGSGSQTRSNSLLTSLRMRVIARAKQCLSLGMAKGVTQPPDGAGGPGSGSSDSRPAEAISGSLPWPRLSEFLGTLVASRVRRPWSRPPSNLLLVLEVPGTSFEKARWKRPGRRAGVTHAEEASPKNEGRKVGPA